LDLQAQLQAALGDAYTIERELGGGGMSRVFVASDRALHRRVVIKVLAPELVAGVSAERFTREIQLSAALQQANIVPLLAAGQLDGVPFYTMPFVEGLTLRARLSEGGALPVTQAISVLRDVARALAYAHERGVIHRDIKPENILLSGDTAVVADFGIAKALSASRTQAPAETITQLGTSIGTPAYMAPEQAAGDPAADHRADLYAFGMVAYELLAGASPFAGKAPHQLIAAHMNERPAPLTSVRADCPPVLASLVMRCLEKEPSARPNSAREVLQALDAVQTPQPMNAARSPRSRQAIAAAAVFAVVVLGAAYAISRQRGPDGDRSIAVLPFENVGGDSTQEYFSDGITDELNSALGQVPGIRVAARSSAYTFKGKRVDARDVGRVLQVANVLEGRIRREGSKLRLTAQLVKSADGLSVWNATFDRDAKDVFAVQEELARAIVGALRLTLDGRAAKPKTAHTTDPTTYDLFLRGKYRLNSAASEHDYEAAIQIFQQVIARDSLYAPPHAAISTAYIQMADAFQSPRAVVPPALAEAQRAVALDSSLADGYAVTGALTGYYLWNVPAARTAFNHALALNPNDPWSLFYSATNAMIEGDSAVTRSRMHDALRLDPLNPFFNAWRVEAWMLLNEPDSAISQYQRLQEASPGFVYLEPWVDDVYRARKQYPEALRIGMEASKTLQHPTSGLIVTLAAMGRLDEAMKQIRTLEAYVANGAYVPPEFLARGWMVLGDRERAISYLQKGAEGQSGFTITAMTWLPELKPLYDDPRVQEIRAKFVLR
jgi:serine/threonine-protein kinase